MSKRLDSTVLQELQYAATRVVRRTQDSTLSDLLTDEDLQDIVLRQLTVVGEAAARISETTKRRFSQIDWRRIVAMRNFVVHEYFRVDYETIWNAIQSHIPPLLTELPTVIEQMQADEQAARAAGV